MAPHVATVVLAVVHGSADTRSQGGIKATGYVSASNAWVALAAMILATLITEFGNSIVGFYTHSIESALRLHDVSFSAAAFAGPAIGAALMILPAGWLADARRRRVPLVIVGLLLESMCVLAASGSANVWEFAAARFGMGAGGVLGVPAMISLIADYFDPGKRALAVSVYGAAALGGSGLVTMLSGLTVRAVAARRPAGVPIIGALEGWHLAFMMIAAGGAIAGLLLALVLREPVRHNTELGMSASTMGAFARYVAGSWRLWCSLFAALWIWDIAYMGLASWGPTLLMRVLGEAPGHVGLALGVTRFLAGPLGALLGGVLAQRAFNHRRRDMTPRFIAGAFGITIIVAIPLIFVRDQTLIAAFGAFVAATGFSAALMNVAFQDLLDNRMRGRMLAVQSFVASLVGALGPTLIALGAEHLFSGRLALWYSVAGVSVIASCAATLIMVASRRPYVAALLSVSRNPALPERHSPSALVSS